MCSNLEDTNQIRQRLSSFAGYEPEIEFVSPVPSAVLVPLIQTPNGIEIVFVKRRSDIRVHPGEYSFPGGHVEETDQDELYAAIRETEEEISHPAQRIEPIGRLGKFPTITNFCIHAFVGVLHPPIQLQPQLEEIDSILQIDLKRLCLANWNRVDVEIPMHIREQIPNIEVHEVVVDGHRIWGATARILRVFISVATGTDPANRRNGG